MMIAITITFMLGTAFPKCVFILGLRNAAPGLLKRGNPFIKALQHVLLIFLKLLSLIAFLLSWLFALVGRESGRQKCNRENCAKR